MPLLIVMQHSSATRQPREPCRRPSLQLDDSIDSLHNMSPVYLRIILAIFRDGLGQERDVP